MFIVVTATHFVDPDSGDPVDPHVEVFRTAAIVRIRPHTTPRQRLPITRVTVAEVGDILVVEPYPKFLARLYKIAGCKTPEGSPDA